MKNTRCRIAGIAAATLAISFLIGTGISDAMKLTHKGGGMRATAIRAKSFAGKGAVMSLKRTTAMRANVVNARSSWKKRRHTLQGLALLGATTIGGASFGIPPVQFPGRTIRPPFERIPDPSDIPRWEDVEHVPGLDMIDSRWLGGPDREPGSYNNPRRTYDTQNELYDISDADCLWDAATWNKVEHWGPQAGPLADDTHRGNWRCDPGYQDWDDDKGSGGKDTTETSGTKDTKDTNETKETKEIKETNAVKEDPGKKGDKGTPGSEGDDPDELRSPIAQEMEAIDMLAGYDSRNRGSGNDRGPGLTRTGSNTPRGLPHAQEHRIGPRHENRPDVAGSPASGLAISSQKSYAASPTPDGGSNPPPGPEFSPIASTTSAAAGSAIANQMGYASSAAVGTDGKDPGPAPGPEF